MGIDYERNKKYFEDPDPKFGIILVGVGLLMLIVLSGGAKLIGLLLIAGGGWLLYNMFAGRPTDADLDADAASGIADLRKRALNKIGLDEDQVKLIAPVVIDGYYYGRLASGVKVKRGKDGNFRSSNYEGVVLFFSEHQLHSYEFQFSLVTPNEIREQTDEYFYKDIVSIATRTSSSNVSGVEVNFEEFKLTTTGGTSITSAIRDTGSFDRTISGAKNLIREKKMAVA